MATSGKQCRKVRRLLVQPSTRFPGIPKVVSGVRAMTLHHSWRERLHCYDRNPVVSTCPDRMTREGLGQDKGQVLHRTLWLQAKSNHNCREEKPLQRWTGWIITQQSPVQVLLVRTVWVWVLLSIFVVMRGVWPPPQKLLLHAARDHTLVEAGGRRRDQKHYGTWKRLFKPRVKHPV